MPRSHQLLTKSCQKVVNRQLKLPKRRQQRSQPKIPPKSSTIDKSCLKVIKCQLKLPQSHQASIKIAIKSSTVKFPKVINCKLKLPNSHQLLAKSCSKVVDSPLKLPHRHQRHCQLKSVPKVINCQSKVAPESSTVDEKLPQSHHVSIKVAH